MREYKTTGLHPEIIDLDNPETYSYLPDSVRDLDDAILKEIGYTYCYFNYWHNPWDEDQESRVETLIKRFTKDRRGNWKNVMWFKEMLFLLQDEIENMC